jgi:hypothetical protein
MKRLDSRIVCQNLATNADPPTALLRRCLMKTPNPSTQRSTNINKMKYRPVTRNNKAALRATIFQTLIPPAGRTVGGGRRAANVSTLRGSARRLGGT